MRVRFTLVSLLGTFCVAACAPPTKPQVAATPFPVVAPLAAPVLPSWIEEISPRDHTDENAQIRLRFSQDVVALEALEAPERQGILNNLTVKPAISGRFVFWTPKMIGFQADEALPPATRFRVTLRSGTADLRGDRLANDLSWTFETNPLTFDDLPGSGGSDVPTVGVRPVITVGTNAAVDLPTLVSRTRFIPEGAKDDSAAVAATTAPSPTPTPTGTPQTDSDASGERTPAAFSYRLIPASDLALNTAYKIEIAAGVRPVRGNLDAAASAGGKVHTYGPLALTGVDHTGRPADQNGYGRFLGGSPLLHFTNALNLDSARKAVTLSPKPIYSDAIDLGDPSSVVIAPAALAPNTHYTISVSTDLTDIYGQHPDKPESATFDTTDLAADFWAPSGFYIFPAGGNLQLNVQATNLRSHSYVQAFKVIDPRGLVYHDTDSLANDTPGTVGPVDSWKHVAVAQPHNQSSTTQVALTKELGGATGMLAYGVSAQTNPYHGPNGMTVASAMFGGVVQLTNIGVFAQIFPNLALIRTHALADGTALSGVQVQVYESRVAADKQPPAEPCASGVTGATGLLRIDSAGFSRCAATSTSSTEAPNLLVIARKGGDWAYSRVLSYSGGYDDGLNGGWSAGEPEQRGTIVSDRSLYQPGETAYFTGLAYFVTNGVLGRGRASAYDLALRSPSGVVRKLGKRSPDEFGAFSLPVSFTKDQELGYYALTATAANGEEVDGSFRVAEFKPPNFSVALKLDAASAVMGASLGATATSKYLFGAPVAGGSGHLFVTRSRAYVSPPGADDFAFGRSWMYPEQEPSVPSDVLQTDVPIAADGTSTAQIPVATDLPYPMTYEADFQTTDAANVAVADSKTFLALPADGLIGIKTPFVTEAKASLDAMVTVVNPDGHAISGRTVHVVLQERKFATATQLVEGGESPQESIEYKDVAQADVTSGAQPIKVTLAAGEPGSYRIRANFSDAKSDASATDSNVWVTGPGEADWGLSQDNHLTLKLDKATYRPGDTATALVTSPYPDAELDFAVIRHGVLYQSRTMVHGAAPRIRFTVTPQMVPNAAIEGVLIRRGPPLKNGVPHGLTQLARIGFAAFNTALDGKYLKVSVSPERGKLGPGDTQHLTLRISGAAQHGAQSEFALMVVNDAILQLTGYRPPDLVKMVYADQSISTRWNDNRSDVNLTSPARTQEKGYGYGGGLMGGAGDTRVRTNFKPVAFYSGLVRTDPSGVAHLQFALPDDLTTWRVLAVAFTRDARFGNGESTFVTTKPLVTNPVLPQFARPGDVLQGGVSVTAPAAAGSVAIEGTLGGGLAFESDKGATARVSQSDRLTAPTQAFRFGMRVVAPHDGTVTFASSLDGAHDAFSVPLTVQTSDVLENVAVTGTTDASTRVPFTIAAGTPADAGGLQATLASTLAPDMAEPVRRALDGGDDLALTVFSRISILADAELMRKTYRQEPDAVTEARLRTDVQTLHGWRAPDGGFGSWSGAKQSDPFLSAFAARALAHATQNGTAGAGAALDQLRPYLAKTLANPGTYKWCKDEPCRSELRLALLDAFAEMGSPRSDFLGEISKHESDLDATERIVFATVLQRAGGAWAAQAVQVRARIAQDVYETGRRSSVNAFYAGTSAQAMYVLMLLGSHARPADVDSAFDALLAKRTDGTWGCNCANALAVDAVLAYARAQGPPPNFSATIAVGQLQRSVTFSGYSKTSEAVAWPMSALPRPSVAVNLTKTGTGRLHYAVNYQYRPPDISPGAYQGVRIDRIVRPANTADPVASFGLAAGQNVSLKAAQVFEIEDRVIVDHPVDQVAIDDPLPAGLEAIDASFQTSTPYYAARADNWEIDYQTIHRDRVFAFAGHLAAGVYALHYLVRSVTPGTYLWPGAQAQLQFAPEQFGRTASARLTIE